jgi:hypothetical protein
METDGRRYDKIRPAERQTVRIVKSLPRPF